MAVRNPLCLLAMAASLGAACGTSDDPNTSVPSAPQVRPDAGVPGTDAGTNPFVPTPTPTPTTPVPSDGACLVQPIDTKGQAPDMLIVMDQSVSMLATRWAPSTDAVNKLTAAYENSIDFGLSLFPPLGTVCDAGKLDVPVGPMHAATIKQTLASTAPVGFTPTAQTLQAALGFLGPRMAAGPDTAASKPAYVLLVTDGEPDCPSANALDPGQGSVDAAAALAAAGIKVYVVGYEVGNANLMNNIAAAGGTAHYYDVKNEAELQAAFAEITKDVVRCDFDLLTDQAMPDPDFIYVTIDGQQVKINQADGWVITGKHITLQGQGCSVLKDGALHTVNAELRCEPVR